MHKKFIFLIFILLPILGFSQDLSDEELKLYTLIKEYRNSKALKSIPLSKSLTFVAQTHVKDLAINNPHNNSFGSNCNGHSWSTKGKWTPCCYTSNHARAQCMWDKPRELTSYNGNGFEIGHMNSAGATANSALSGWKKSPGHNNVIINKGAWSKSEWNAIGIGIYENYAVVWFGKEEDKN